MTKPKRYNQRSNPPTQFYRQYSAYKRGNNLPNAEHGISPNQQAANGHDIPESVVIVNKEKWAIADKIALFSVIVAAILAYFTYRLYSIASEDSKTANISALAADNSAKIAQKTLEATNKYDLASLIKQQKAIDDNRKSSQLAFDRANKSLTLQDSSLKETQKEFDIENRPFIQVSDINVDTSSNKYNITVKCNLINTGKQPAQIISAKTAFIYSNEPNFSDFTNLKVNQHETGAYITNGMLSPITFYGKEDTPIIYITYVKKGKCYIYLLGEFIYRSVGTHKKYNYKFDLRIGVYPHFEVATIQNADI
ncbi:hypothetical protein [Flavobacterium sp. UBA6046]|jgi:hypothetical protein|uniref:hypothetical protein n=1 Tax=Flavobacterium sp. UBA6046 TaxID=1946552 RepID=UPI0025BC0F97|nr:hypothetical protein [Flavobacterium sp. UBA6046]